MKKITCGVIIGLLCLCACGRETTVDGQPAVNSQTEVLTKAEQAGILQQESISEYEAQKAAEKAIDLSQYTVSLTEDTAEETETARRYYVYDVTDESGASVGRIAVDKADGARYTYLGGGKLDDYENFPLYNEAADTEYDWQGSYQGPAGAILVIAQQNEQSFVFDFDDDTAGQAIITGHTACSENGEINFLFSESGVTVVGGAVTGNYTPTEQTEAPETTDVAPDTTEVPAAESDTTIVETEAAAETDAVPETAAA